MEVCLDGHRGTVCDDGWDINDATTVCRQLGHTDISKNYDANYMILHLSCNCYLERAIPTRGAHFGEGSGPIHLSRTECRSNDTRLIDCTINKTGMNGCDHSEDAGVICVGKLSMLLVYTLLATVFIQNRP